VFAEQHTTDFDTRGHRFITFGGDNDDGRLNTTYTLTAGSPTWTILTTANDPPARSRHASAYDPNWDRLIVFGGLYGSSTPLMDLWELRLNDTPEIRPAAPEIVYDEFAGGNHSVDVTILPSYADSTVGRGVEYDLRYSTAEITEGNFSGATQVTGEPTPSWPGTADIKRVTGLGNCSSYYFAVKEKDAFGNWSAMSNVVYQNSACGGGFGSAQLAVVPTEVALGAPRPNPSRATTAFSYDVPSKYAGSRVDLTVYDVLGRRVRTLRGEMSEAGSFHASWNRLREDGSRAAAGVYFIRLSVGSETRTRSILLQ
jgi:hypothetical protein